MIDTDMFVRMAAGDAEVPTLFPYPLPFHIVFAIVAAVFFIYRFVTNRKPFQLIFALAVPFSLTLWISESRTWFYIVGAVELLFVLAALVSVFIFKDKKSDEAADTEDSAEAQEVPEETADTEDPAESVEVSDEADGE